MENTRRSNKTALLIGITIIYFCAYGSCSLLGICIPYFMQSFGLELSAVSLAGGLGNLVGFLVSLIGTKLIDWLTPKVSAIVGIIIIGLHLICYAVAQSLPLVIFGAMISGIGLGLISQATVGGVLAPVFKEKAQWAMGVCFAVCAYGSAAFQAIATIFTASMPYGTVLKIMGIAVMVVGVGINLVTIPKQRRLTAEERAAKAQAAAEAKLAISDEPGMTFAEAKATPAFILLFIASITCGWGGNPINSLSSGYLVTLGFDKVFLNSMITACTFLGGIYGLVLAPLCKKMGPRKYGMTVMVLIAVAMLAFALVPAFGNSIVVVVIAYVIGGMNRAGMTVSGMIIPDVFGRKQITAITSFMNAGFFVGTTTTYFIWPNVAKLIGWNVTYGILAVICVIGGILFSQAAKFSPFYKQKMAHKQ